MDDVARLARWIERLPIAEAVVREPESAWLGSLDLPAPVLDVGCGDGLFASMTFAAPLAVGLDRSERALRRARASGAYRSVVRADVRTLPFRAGVFGAVVSNGALEHVPGVEKGLAEIARVTRPGGRFALTVPGPRCGGADRISRGRFVPPWEAWVNRLWSHVNLWPPDRWEAPQGAWEREARHDYLGLRRYRVCLGFFWVGGPGAAACRVLGGRRVLSRGWRRIWAGLAASLIGPDASRPGEWVSYGLLLRRTAAGAPDLGVRRASAEDAEAIARIDALGRPGDLLTALGHSFLAALYRALASDPQVQFFVAERDGAVVGFVVGAPESATLYRRLVRAAGPGLAIRAAATLFCRPAEVVRLLSVLRYASAPSAGGDLRAELVVMGVHPDHRRRGTGEALWRALAEAFRRAGAPGFFLMVREENAAARRFYERMGMREEGAERISGGLMLRYAIRWGSTA